MADDDTIHPNEIDNEALKDFKQQVNKWCELDSKIKQYEQVVKAQKKLKDEFCGNILSFMQGYDISDLKTPFGKLQKVESYPKAPLTKGLIGEKIENYFNQMGVKNSKEQSNTLVRELYNNRVRQKSVRLKRVVPKATAEGDGTTSTTTSSTKQKKTAGNKIKVPDSLKHI